MITTKQARNLGYTITRVLGAFWAIEKDGKRIASATTRRAALSNLEVEVTGCALFDNWTDDELIARVASFDGNGLDCVNPDGCRRFHSA